MFLGTLFAGGPFHHECGLRFLVVLVLHHAHLFSWRFFENDCCKENQTDFTIKFFLELIYIGSYLSTSFIKLFLVEFFCVKC